MLQAQGCGKAVICEFSGALRLARERHLKPVVMQCIPLCISADVGGECLQCLQCLHCSIVEEGSKAERSLETWYRNYPLLMWMLVVIIRTLRDKAR